MAKYSHATLRAAYPNFEYTDAQYKVVKNDLICTFHYQAKSTEPTFEDLTFTHTLNYQGCARQALVLEHVQLEGWIFLLGMAEALNYWKATCSPTITISAGWLPKSDLTFWHDLLINGMGEYFFVNDIDFTDSEFVQFVVTGEKSFKKLKRQQKELEENNILIPIGGGKDSAVTLQILGKNGDFRVTGFMLNPIPSALKTVKALDIKNTQIVTRKIDPTLLLLNDKGYLNGHVPFSAILAFVSTFFARINGDAYVTLSNEGSANEGSALFNGKMVNHQYSKTFDFEKKFQRYVERSEILSEWKVPYYFSFLRPLFELQIARIFSKYIIMHQTFRSCNKGQHSGSWCQVCSKCLFAYAIMAPFIDLKELERAFGSNLFTNESLYQTALELIGSGEHKPLECVGTYEESLIAFSLAAELYPKQPLLKLLSDQLLTGKDLKDKAAAMLTSWNSKHALSRDFEQMLTEELRS